MMTHTASGALHWAEWAVELPDADATERLGEWLGERLQVGDTLGLTGEVGSGKTTLTRALARGLQVDDPDAVASPTYLLMIEHPGVAPLIHIDAYLPAKTEGFLIDGGVDYLAEARGVVVVEWADRLREWLPEETVWLSIAPRRGGGRLAILRAVQPRFVRLTHLAEWMK